MAVKSTARSARRQLRYAPRRPYPLIVAEVAGLLTLATLSPTGTMLSGHRWSWLQGKSHAEE
jgi:hypothetical protein